MKLGIAGGFAGKGTQRQMWS